MFPNLAAHQNHLRNFLQCRYLGNIPGNTGSVGPDWGLVINEDSWTLLKATLQFSNVMILKGKLVIRSILFFILIFYGLPSAVWKPQKATDPTENKSEINHWYRRFIQERNLGKLTRGMKTF